MKSVVHELGKLKIRQMKEPVAGKGGSSCCHSSSGFNRGDLYIPARRGEDAEALILGSDGAGVFESIGDEVIINLALRWYLCFKS